MNERDLDLCSPHCGPTCPMCAGQYLERRAQLDALGRRTVRAAARNRCPLDGADAQALEHALTITERERDAARAEVAKLRGYLETLLTDVEAAREYKTGKGGQQVTCAPILTSAPPSTLAYLERLAKHALWEQEP